MLYQNLCPPPHSQGKRYRCCKVDYSQRTFLGFDLSTQKLKAVILNAKLEVLFSAEIKYDIDLPEYGTESGACRGENPDEYLVNPVMWVKALDMVLNCLKTRGADMSTIAAISGSGQQHGSVYWSEKGYKLLCGLMLPKRLHEQIDERAFTITKTPIWMDGSTKDQCQDMESNVGGAVKMASITGSKCYERFTGPQIRKIYEFYPDAYERTIRISLVSSFLATLFIGNMAPIDYSDGSGMNLLNIKTKKWSARCLDACAPNLEQRLMEPIPPNELVGHIHPYYVQRWGFRPDCMIAPSTGDNPSALAGLSLSENEIIISLGTSDTIILHLKNLPKLREGHIFCHPTVINDYMGLLCFRNGSMVRETMCRELTGGNWNVFNKLLDNSPPGNGGNMAMHFHDMEIIPQVKGTLRWSSEHGYDSEDSHIGLKNFDQPETEARALVEGQMLHHRAIAIDMGFTFGSNTRIVATGGASVNKALLQVISDVFNSPVYIQAGSEAALMGAAYRARYAFFTYRESACTCRGSKRQPHISYRQLLQCLLPYKLKLMCKPIPNSDNIYLPMIERYNRMVTVMQRPHHRSTTTSEEKKHSRIE